MSLIKCPECGKEISDKAFSCPNCGFPMEPKVQIVTKPCSYCGEVNPINSDYCDHCGMRLTDYNLVKAETAITSETETYQDKSLLIQEEQLKINSELLELEKTNQFNQAHCPKCGSSSLTGNKKGFGIGKAVVGAWAFGPIGLIAGNINSKKIIVTCMNCGYKFKL